MKKNKNSQFALCLMLVTVLNVLSAQENRLDERENLLSRREQILQEQIERHKKFIEELVKKNKEDKAQRAAELDSFKKKWKESLENKDLEIQKLREAKDERDAEKKKQFFSIYEKMEPKQAAKVLETLDRNLASELVSEMKAQRAAEILGKMSAEKAKEITEASLRKRQRHSQKVNQNTENSPIAPIGLAK